MSVLRELQRKRENELVLVPKMKESYIVRDNWTKLNVLPSTIMQVLYLDLHAIISTVKSRRG